MVRAPSHCFFLSATAEAYMQKHRKSLASEINKRISSLNSNDSEARNRPTKGSKTPSDVELRARAVSTKINDGNIKAAVRIAASNDSLAPVNADTLKKLQGKHPESRENIQPPDFIEQHFVVDAKAVSKCILSFPSGSAGGPDKLTPQILKDLISPCTGEAGKKLLISLTLFVNTLAAGKLPAEFRPYFFSANLFALGKKDDGVCPRQYPSETCVQMCKTFSEVSSEDELWASSTWIWLQQRRRGCCTRCPKPHDYGPTRRLYHGES